jgi:16S rRNA (cytosine1402-N4)-methyltransferase
MRRKPSPASKDDAPRETREHTPVLLEETLHWLALREDSVVVDATVGWGGHAREVLKRIRRGRLIGLDRDDDALRHTHAILGDDPRVQLLHSNYADLPAALRGLGVPGIDAILMDLGVSSPQLDWAERGFTFQHDAPLDMRMDRTQGLTAREVVNGYPEEGLAKILFQYGEEPKARLLARSIAAERAKRPFETTGPLAEMARRLYRPGKGRAPSRRDPATRLFQAIRIEVNDEIGSLRAGLAGSLEVLKPGGRLVAISFHSLEDREVKTFMREEGRDCLCPPKSPTCTCGHRARLKELTRKPVEAAEKEVRTNPRSRSAKLRAAEKLPDREEREDAKAAKLG